jgi:cbb3-type cytochrome oxidase subunit 3
MYDIIIIIILILLIYYLLFNKSKINKFDYDGYIVLNKNIQKLHYLTFQ